METKEDKAKAIAEAIINTSKSVIEVWKQVPSVAGKRRFRYGPINRRPMRKKKTVRAQAMSAFIAAMGAQEVACIISQPLNLNKFPRGTEPNNEPVKIQNENTI